jgi:ribosomal protein S27E
MIGGSQMPWPTKYHPDGRTLREVIKDELNPKPKVLSAKCPKCGYRVVLGHMGETVECPKCGMLLSRKNSVDEKLVLGSEEATELSEEDAGERWRRDHPDY